ncbi:alpha,alpha-trehalose-phosphate synthase (UDP-forming) [Streptomyces litchfieldiae]|uniref:Trehalose-6-phosphate synthase n=1 Tax=Streptomyces litchfieldiae TaxID=3075543 RepID=A0ABU2MNX4_9ACTN|nr:trehalose-6-phosphate synthase [Streptomyces sp. DSM 44938]MDT0343309.1 trehalose-6-phosphate synthase [Streptomyces sp. DSM 44938]
MTATEHSAEHPPGPDTEGQVLVASNRGPVSFTLGEDGSLTARRGGGGLVTGLSALRPGTGTWICAALGEGDRAAVARFGSRLDPADTGGQAVRMLDIPAGTFEAAYNGVANSVLWFIHHLLYQTPFEPVFDAAFEAQWSEYAAYNAAFADALTEDAAPGSAVLVQDYHLSLVPGLLRERRPDLRVGHFSHTPWAPPELFRVLPDAIARRVLLGILGADRAAFLTRRWARAFAACCADVLGAEMSEADGLTVTHGGRTTRLGVHGLGADAEFLRERAFRPDVDERLAALRAQVGDRRTIVRVDRTELSKNIVRGLLAYRRLLTDRPQWRGRVTHVAFAYPSRQDLAVYREYTAEVSRVAEEINAAFGTEGWTPVVLHVKDDFARSLAAYRMADVALVNPIRDGMNLVAKEVPVVSERGCALVLSREAGAAAELGEDALLVNPYDIAGTAEALHRALSMDADERDRRTKRLSAAATALPPQTWFLEQLAALRG